MALVALVIIAGSGEALSGNDNDPKVHFERAQAAFALGKYADSAIEFERTFELKPQPALLYNAAQAHRLAGSNERALLLYQNLLRVYGSTLANRSEVEGHIAKLHEALQSQIQGKMPPPSARSTAATPPTEPQTITPRAVLPPNLILTVPTTAARSDVSGSARVAVPSPPPAAPKAPVTPRSRRPLLWVALLGAALIAAGAVTVGIVFGTAPRDPTPTMGSVQVGLAWTP